MVAGGDTNLVEVIDTKSEKKCQALPSVPKSKLLDAFGALIDGKPLICGEEMKIFILQKYIQIFLKSSNYSFVPFGRLIVVFVYAFCFTDICRPSRH